MRENFLYADYSVEIYWNDSDLDLEALVGGKMMIDNSELPDDDSLPGANRTANFAQLTAFLWALPIQFIALSLVAPGDGGRWIAVAVCVVAFNDLVVMVSTPRDKQLPLFVAATIAAGALAAPVATFLP